nr:feruloyl CoA ortho-hydroxylase 1-like [Tanacetum cinerariifolium]
MPTIDSNSINILDFVVNQGHGVKGLAELGLETLPHQYIQPPQERFNTTHEEENKDSIPVIDMSNSDDPNVAKAICDAAQKWGFFQIVNHGKSLYTQKNNRLHIMEWKDYLSLFYVSDTEAASLWPPTCRDQALEYIKSSELVVKKLLDILMNGLNVKEIDETKESKLMGSKRINLNYYPKCPNPELTVGVGRHSDVSTLTILLQDDIGGLFVRNIETMKWIHVPPVSGSLVINVGDALQIMSNGKYKSVEHRVTANGSNNRISVPIFVNPKPSDVIGPLEELIASGEEPLYKNVLYSDYVKHFFRKAHDGKATI